MFAQRELVAQPPVVTQVLTPAPADQPYFEFQVERQAAAAASNAQPRYPDTLRATGLGGEVLVQFVVDANGNVEPQTLKALKSSHDLFTQAVRAVLPGWRFAPAQIGGRSVSQIVQMPFQFTP
jgi:protein TonB